MEGGQSSTAPVLRVKLVLVSVSGELPQWLLLAAKEYEKKISHLFPFEFHLLKSPKVPREQSDLKRVREGEALLQFLKPQDLVYLLDETGKSLDSISFSKALERDFSSGKQRVVFVVGGAFGASDALKARADVLLSLSSFVLSHHIALILVFEQLYRALAIQKNLPYHNA